MAMTSELTLSALGIVLALVAGVGAYIFLTASGRPVYADAGDVKLVERGREVYAQACASCHGANLEGQPNWQIPLAAGGRPAPPHDETGHTWHHPDQLLFELTKFGGQAYSPADYQNNMPAFSGSLSDKEILAALAYIKSSWPSRIQAQQERVNRRAAER